MITIENILREMIEFDSISALIRNLRDIHGKVHITHQRDGAVNYGYITPWSPSIERLISDVREHGNQEGNFKYKGKRYVYRANIHLEDNESGVKVTLRED